MLKWITILEAIVIVVLGFICLNYYNAIISINNQLSDAQGSILSYQSQIRTLNSDKFVLENKEKTLENTVAELTKKLDDTLPYKSEAGQIKLTNQSNTHNPTWVELKIFLANDATDKIPYVDGSFTCGDFAQKLHDNAEKVGIRGGVVAIHFEKEGQLVERTIDFVFHKVTLYEMVYPHAINCFYTTDKGLIYIDDTGTTNTECKYDAVGYIEVGKDYGMVDCDVVTSFTYSFYENIKQQWQQYNKDMDVYNSEVSKYNAYVNGKVFYIDTLEWNNMKAWRNKLDIESLRLDNVSKALPECFAESVGIVKSITKLR
jgi:hypothetical protein